MGERYKSLTKETEGVLKGEYGATPAPVNAALQTRVLQGAEAITCRPADLLMPELVKLRLDLAEKAQEQGIRLSSEHDDDVLTYALFPQIGLQFLKNRDNPSAFEPKPELTSVLAASNAADRGPETYTVTVEGQEYVVEVAAGGEISQIQPQGQSVHAVQAVTESTMPATSHDEVRLEMSAPLSGNIFKVHVSAGDRVREGDVVIILEAMKMETEIRAQGDGIVAKLWVKEGDSVSVGSQLLALA